MKSLIIYVDNISQEQLQLTIRNTGQTIPIHKQTLQSHKSVKRNLGYAFSQISVEIQKCQHQIVNWVINLQEIGQLSDTGNHFCNYMKKSYQDCAIRIQLRNRTQEQTDYKAIELENKIYQIAQANLKTIIKKSFQIIQSKNKSQNIQKQSFKKSIIFNSSLKSKTNFQFPLINRYRQKSNKFNQNMCLMRCTYDNNSQRSSKQIKSFSKTSKKNHQQEYITGRTTPNFNHLQNLPTLRNTCNLDQIQLRSNKVKLSMFKQYNEVQVVQKIYKSKNNKKQKLVNNKLLTTYDLQNFEIQAYFHKTQNFPNLFSPVSMIPFRQNCIKLPIDQKNYGE